jgi:hypothetical protein
MFSSVNPPRKRRFIFFGLLLFALTTDQAHAQSSAIDAATQARSPTADSADALDNVGEAVAVEYDDVLPNGQPEGRRSCFA